MDQNNLSAKDVLLVVSPLLAFAIGVFLYANGYELLAALILVPIGLFLVYGFLTAPWNEIAKEAYEKEQIQKQTFGGRLWIGVVRVFDYLNMFFFAVLLLGLALMVYEKVFSFGS